MSSPPLRDRGRKKRPDNAVPVQPMNNTKYLRFFKHTAYVLLLLVLYVLQTVPGLFVIYGTKPILVVPAAIAIAMLEGEFVGGVYGAVAGLLCDMGGFSLFGFNGFVITVCCVAAGLLIIYLLRCNLWNCLLLVLVTLLLRGSVEYVFSYGMWGYEGVWKIYVYRVLAVVAYSVAVTPAIYFLTAKLHNGFYAAERE